jgi:beta-lactamase superfamily II metal-dependent hydrolase
MPTARALAVVLLAATVRCGGDAPSAVDESGQADLISGARFSWRRAVTRNDVPPLPPTRGKFRIHLIDVGTGLSVLVQGADFTLLYDGGSGDDRAGIIGTGPKAQNGNRLLAYLFAALGPSGAAECTPDGDGWPKQDRMRVRIDHLFLSHPHEDHDSLLDDVVRCYDVKQVWDSGDDNDRDGYAKFMTQVAAQPGIAYHNAAGLSKGDVIQIGKTPVTIPADAHEMREGDVQPLGFRAQLTLLHVNGMVTQDENLNSTVVRVQLGKTSLLLMGDAESGARAAPGTALGHIEADLVARQAANLKADILQVAHHGSSTSSRLGILNLIQPKLALIGVGPLPYAGVKLPDPSVIDAIAGLASKPTILRTDANDAAVQSCSVNGVKVDRIGLDDGHPGGCDNYVIDVTR